MFRNKRYSPIDRAAQALCPRPATATQRRDSESPTAIWGSGALACVAPSLGQFSPAPPSWWPAAEPGNGVPPFTTPC
jgi:hypothetical protein